LTDGYKGNLSLKWMEASFGILKDWAKGETDKFNWSDKMRLAFGSATLKRVKQNLLDKANPDRYSGAIVLGYEGVVVKGHGASGSDAIYHGLCRLANCTSEDSGKKLADTVRRYMPK